MNLYMSVVAGLFLAYIFGYIGSLLSPSVSVLDAAASMAADFKPLFRLNSKAIMGILLGLISGGIYYFYSTVHEQKTYSYKKNEVAGSARFMTKKEMAEYTKEFIEPNPADLKKPFPNLIMSQNFSRPVDSRKLMGNNNVLVVGAAGTGKSRFFIKPNILQMNSSYVITDPSGEMIYSMGNILKEFGYKIKIFNISDMEHSNCYNPLQYIRNEAGVNMLIDCFIKNTTKDGAKGDEFFTNAERLLYSACIYYLWQNCTDESRKNFGSIINMINSSAVDENNANAKSPLDELFDGLPQDCLAWKFYKAFKQAAGKTLKSIIISCVTRLQPFLTPQVANLTKVDNLELEKMGDELTALFIITPQADQTYSFLASMLYTQLFETLYFKGEEQKAMGGSERLKYPVRCLMDEFANIGEVPEFPSKLSTMRKYNISATVILQDISQIEAMYKEEWKTLVGNCSSIIFLGSAEPNTLKYFSEMLGKGTVVDRGRGISHGKMSGANQNFKNQARELRFADELGRMDSSECIVFTANMYPVLDKKYDYLNHPRYKETADYDNEKGFMYKGMAIYDNQKLSSINSILKAKSESCRITRQNKVTDSKKLNEGKLDLTKEESLEKFKLQKETEQKSFIHHAIVSETQLHDMKNYPVAFSLLESVPTHRVISIAKQNFINMNEQPLIVFSDTHAKIITGVGKSNTDDQLYVAMKNELTKEYKVVNGVCVIKINRNRLNEYKNKVLAFMSQHDEISMETQQKTNFYEIPIEKETEVTKEQIKMVEQPIIDEQDMDFV